MVLLNFRWTLVLLARSEEADAQRVVRVSSDLLVLSVLGVDLDLMEVNFFILHDIFKVFLAIFLFLLFI